MPRSHEHVGLQLPNVDAATLLGDAGPAAPASSIGAGSGLVIAVAWITVGVAAALVLGRRGHDVRSVIGLAAVLGPLFVPLARGYVRDRDPYTTAIVSVPTPTSPGRRMIIMLLGPPERVVDAVPLMASINDIGSLTLATLIDFESAQRPEWDEQKQEARQRLQRAASLLDGHAAGQVMVPGTLEQGVARLSPEADDVIVLVGDSGTRGAERLRGPGGVPVISVPPTDRR